jgi:hypothetical protein
MRRVVAPLLAMTMVAACATGPPPSAADVSAAPPAARPVADLSAALREILRAPGPYRLRMERTQTSETTTSHIIGTMRVTPSAWAAEGTRTDQAVGSEMVAQATYEMVWIGDSGYTRSDAGAWIPFTGLFDHPLRLTEDPDAGTFVPVEEVVEEGRTITRIRYADPTVIDPVFVLAIGNELEDVTAIATYDLTPAGHLVRVRSSLSGQRLDRFGGGTITHDATYTVLPGLPDPITAPATDWTLYRSTRLPLSFALPPGWSSTGVAGESELFGGKEGSASVRLRSKSLTIPMGELVDSVRSDYLDRGIGEPGSVVPTYLGQEAATAVIYPGVDLGNGPVNVVHLVGMFDGAAYDVVWTMQPGVLQDQFDMIGDVATSWHWGSS